MEPSYAPPLKPFYVRVYSRLFRITALEPFEEGHRFFVPVDCRDTEGRMESQAIVELEECQSREALLKVSMVRDAIRSAYLNSTKGHAPEGFAYQIL